jgi:hypothetical protein
VQFVSKKAFSSKTKKFKFITKIIVKKFAITN